MIYAILNVEIRAIWKRHKDCVHLKLKPFACGECEMKFGQASELKKHKNGVHLKLKPFACDLCELKFGVAGDLKVHKDCVHSK